MTLEEFVNRKNAYWSELDSLLNTIQRGNLKALSAQQIERLGYLYRRVTSDLAIARRDFSTDRTVNYLNDLAARAHAGVYQSKPIESGRIRDFFLSGFPQLFRKHIIFIAVAFGFFLIGFIGTYFATLINPNFGESLIPEKLVHTIESHEMWTDIPQQQRSLASSLIMTNNIQVAFFAFAFGVTFALGTVYVLLSNGMMIGAVGGLCHIHGLSLPLWSFVSPHGYIELTVIFIAGGAGLMMGYALVNPGLASRKRALADAAKQSVRLIGGCVPLLIIAGTIEGFVSPSSLPPWVKILLGAVTGVLLYSYLFSQGKRARGQEG